MLLRTTPLACILLTLVAATGTAQRHDWTIGLDVGRASTGGSSRDTASVGNPAFRPNRPTVVSLQVDRRVGGVSIGLIGSYGVAHLGLEGPDLLLVDGTVQFTFYELAPVIGIPLTGLGHDGRLALTAGPVVALWRITDQPDRTRVGARLGVSLPVFFGQAIGGLARLDGVVTPSVFEAGELPADFILQATWRVQVSLGVLVGL